MSDKLTTLEQLRNSSMQSKNAVTAVASAAADAIEEVHGLKADKATFIPFSIPINGWNTDTSIPGYTKYVDITVDGLTAADCVAVDVAPSSIAVARTANFTVTESRAGVLRLRAASVPTAAISAQYHIITAAPAAKEV